MLCWQLNNYILPTTKELMYWLYGTYLCESRVCKMRSEAMYSAWSIVWKRIWTIYMKTYGQIGNFGYNISCRLLVDLGSRPNVQDYNTDTITQFVIYILWISSFQLPCAWHQHVLNDKPATPCYCTIPRVTFNTLRPGQNGRHFADDIFKCIFFNENVWIPIKISLKFVSKRPINNNPALVQIMAWRRPGDKPLSEPMMVSLTTHICVTRPQWVNICYTQSG